VDNSSPGGAASPSQTARAESAAVNNQWLPRRLLPGGQSPARSGRCGRYLDGRDADPDAPPSTAVSASPASQLIDSDGKQRRKPQSEKFSESVGA